MSGSIGFGSPGRAWKTLVDAPQSFIGTTGLTILTDPVLYRWARIHVFGATCTVNGTLLMTQSNFGTPVGSLASEAIHSVTVHNYTLDIDLVDSSRCLASVMNSVSLGATAFSCAVVSGAAYNSIQFSTGAGTVTFSQLIALGLPR